MLDSKFFRKFSKSLGCKACPLSVTILAGALMNEFFQSRNSTFSARISDNYRKYGQIVIYSNNILVFTRSFYKLERTVSRNWMYFALFSSGLCFSKYAVDIRFNMNLNIIFHPREIIKFSNACYHSSDFTMSSYIMITYHDSFSHCAW